MLSRMIWGGRASLLLGVARSLLGLVARRRCSAWSPATSGAGSTRVLTGAVRRPAVVPAAHPGAHARHGVRQRRGRQPPRARMVVLILALGVVSIPVLGPHHPGQHARVVAARVRHRRPGPWGPANRAIMFREVLPNVLPAMFSIALLGIAVVIVAEGGLSRPGRRRPAAHAVVGQHHRRGPRRLRGRARTSCSSPSSRSSSRCWPSTTWATWSVPASTCGRAPCDPQPRAGQPRAAPVARRLPPSPGGRLLEVDDLTTHFRTPRGRCGRSTACRSRSTGAARSASSASRAAASRCCPARSWACCRTQRRPRRARSSSRASGSTSSAPPTLRDVLGHADGDGLPGPDDLAQPGHAHRQADHRVARVHTDMDRSEARETALALLRVGAASPSRSGGSGSTRTSCRAACASGSSSPSRWPAGPSCCSPTSPRPRST